ncbi:hypothetical protein MMC25_005357 [Agyrium rufum]|nr:hypothetical protein [Agyrium rufum]
MSTSGSANAKPPPDLFTVETVRSLAVVVGILVAAITTSRRLLPSQTSTKLRIIYVWHFFDALIHLIIEASFLYNCFFTYSSIPHTSDYPHPASLTAEGVHFLGYKDRLYGANYGTNIFATLWQEYARADARWGGADLTVISLEILTVGIGGPLALYIADLIRRGAGTSVGGAKLNAKLWFWASALATGELYGGFMTFAPEWLSANSNLDTSNFMYMWIYLFLFNMLWVWLPAWVLWEAYQNISAAFTAAESTSKSKKSR